MFKRMIYKSTGFGLGQFANEDVVVFGGARTGKLGTEGTARLRYWLYDMAAIRGGTPQQDAQFGECELNVLPGEKDEDWSIEGIVHIEVDKNKRGIGLGRRAVMAIAATAAGDCLKVYDVQPNASGFWEALGFSLHRRPDGSEMDGELAVEAPRTAAAPRR